MKYNRMGLSLLVLRIAIGGGLLGLSTSAPAGDVYWNKMKANKILFLGNSITLHGPNASLGWSGNWGMAATEESKDYVHTLTTAINTTIGGSVTVAANGTGGADNVINIADIFERNYATYANSRLQTQIDYQSNLVILQFGENMATVSTEEQKAAFKSSLETLLNGLRDSSNPNIFVTSYIISANATVDAIKQEVCAEDPTHRRFVDLSAFRSDLTNYARSEGVFFNSGVAGHPGNKGMQYIADGVYAAMATHSTVTPEPCSCMLLTTGALASAAFLWRKRKEYAKLKHNLRFLQDRNSEVESCVPISLL